MCMRAFVCVLHGDKECPFSGIISSGRVWKEGAGKRCLECVVVLFVCVCVRVCARVSNVAFVVLSV